MASNEVKVIIKAEDQATATLKKTGDEAENAGKKAGGLGSALGGVSQVAGGMVIGAGIMKIGGFLMEAANAAKEDEAATLRLEQAVRNSGAAFDESMAKINERIEVGADLAFSDDQVRDSFQKLLAATGDVDEAMRRQTLAMDLARGAGIPLEQASTLLGKVTAENVEVFKKMGITIGEGASEAEAFAVIQQKFGGQADAYAKSTAGQMESASLKMGELKEQIGSALIPVMAGLGTVLADKVIPFIEKLVTRFEEFRPTLESVAKEIGEKVVPVITTLFEYLKDNEHIIYGVSVAIGTVLVGAFTAWAVSATAAAVASVVALAPLYAIVAVLAVYATAFIYLYTHWDELTKRYPILGQITDTLKEKFEQFTAWLTDSFIPAVKEIYTVVSEVVAATIAFVQEHWDEIRAVVEPAVKFLWEVIKLHLDLIEIAFRTWFGVIKGIFDFWWAIFRGDWQGAMDALKGIVSTVLDGIKAAFGALFDFFTSDLVPRAKTAGGEIVEGIRDGMGALAGRMLDVGRSLIAAFFNGIKAKFWEGIGEIKDLLNPTKWDIPGLSPLPDAMAHAGDIAAKKFIGGLSSGLLAGASSLNQVVTQVIGPTSPLGGGGGAFANLPGLSPGSGWNMYTMPDGTAQWVYVGPDGSVMNQGGKQIGQAGGGGSSGGYDAPVGATPVGPTNPLGGGSSGHPQGFIPYWGGWWNPKDGPIPQEGQASQHSKPIVVHLGISDLAPAINRYNGLVIQ